jgi:hypothetical protein
MQKMPSKPNKPNKPKLRRVKAKAPKTILKAEISTGKAKIPTGRKAVSRFVTNRKITVDHTGRQEKSEAGADEHEPK